MEKDPKLAESVITSLIKFWPVTNSQKEVLFLSELEELLELTQQGEFEKIVMPLFKQLSACLNSSHFQVGCSKWLDLPYAPYAMIALMLFAFVNPFCVFTGCGTLSVPVEQ